MKKRKTPARPSPAVRRLRRRLQEAEDTLNAIRDGHVEALVVRSAEGEQIYTLRSADQPFRLMVEQMREGAVTLAADGTVLYCNRRFAEMVACPPERVTGQPFGEFVEAGDRLKLQGMLKADSFRDEFQLRTRLGSSNAAQVSSTAMEIDQVRTVAVVVSDLTHERIERGLRESNRLKDEFLATLSHELRTPLNVILGWTQMLLANHLTNAARRHALGLIDRNAQAQAQLVNDLVDMSRITTGKLRLELEPLPLVPALEAALESIRPAAAVKHLKIDTSWKVQDVNVLADATRLQQVLWNLLSNAVKFTPDGGRIAVRTSQGDERVLIEVSDTGIGIDPEFLPYVFDRFRQGESGTTRRYGGLGLGLAIVHDLVRLHGGEVSVQSEGAGLGSTFVVTLRTSTKRVDVAERRGRSRKTPNLVGQSVLLLEDHPDSRQFLVQALQNAGAAVVAFGTAREAFEALNRLRPSVIVADIGLPGEDGYSFIRRVRAHGEPLESVPAIAVTAYTTGPDRDLALAAGFQQHLAKPIDTGRLVEAIHDLTRRSRDP
jgi:PAS domain S-box-containing protein